MADEVGVAAAREIHEVPRHFLSELLGVHDVAVERDRDLDAVGFSGHGLRALHDGLVVAFARGCVADVADA